MGLFDKFKTSTAIDRLSEERLYEQVAQELKAGKKREGIWVKAMAKTGGNLNKAESMYIELRVQSLRDEHIVEKEMSNVVRPFKSKFHEGSIAYECDYILATKGYMLHRQLWADWWISAKSNRESCYHSDDLKKIKEWAINAEDLT